METTIIGLLALLFLSCQTVIKTKNKEKVEFDTINIIQDPLVNRGVGLKGNDSGKPQFYDYLNPFGGGKEPIWELAQWGSRFKIDGKLVETNNKQAPTYQDEAKRITFLHLKEDTQIVLELSGSKEYKQPRKQGENWPHLLMEQHFISPVKLDDIAGLLYNINTQLIYCDNKMSAGTMKEDLHTAQITLFLSVQNLTQNSKGYRDFIWFGLPLYDYRYKMVPAYKAQDAGKGDASGKYIYSLASQDLSTESVHTKNWVHMSNDIYPHITQAFKEAKAKGYLVDTEWKDLRIASMNLGWELPGTFDAGIQWKALTLKALKKINAN